MTHKAPTHETFDIEISKETAVNIYRMLQEVETSSEAKIVISPENGAIRLEEPDEIVGEIPLD